MKPSSGLYANAYSFTHTHTHTAMKREHVVDNAAYHNAGQGRNSRLLAIGDNDAHQSGSGGAEELRGDVRRRERQVAAAADCRAPRAHAAVCFVDSVQLTRSILQKVQKTATNTNTSSTKCARDVLSCLKELTLYFDQHGMSRRCR
jgi:hypothetical protein